MDIRVLSDAMDDARSRLREIQAVGSADEKLNLDLVQIQTFYDAISVINQNWVDSIKKLDPAFSPLDLYSVLVTGILKTKGQWVELNLYLANSNPRVKDLIQQ